MRRRLALALLFGFVGILFVEWSLYRAIRQEARRDEARPADVIIVFGAAQYNGMPSPVFKARLDHAFDLEERGFAPIVITTGGRGSDAHFTEAGVGRDYLIQKGTSAEKVLSAPYGDSTFESVRYVVRWLRRLHAKRCIAVSDGFHLYRIKRMLAAQGITAYGSPAPSSPIEIDPFQRVFHSLREMLVSTLWYLGIHG